MDKGEVRAVEWFRKMGLSAERFPKKERRGSRTPDFRVSGRDELCFHAEVKTITEDEWLQTKLREAPPGVVAGGTRPDPTFNRLSAKVHEAVRQFDAVDPDGVTPRVLVFVNFEDSCDYGDLLGVLTGDFFAEDGTRHRIYGKYAEGRISDDRNRVDVYVWIDHRGRVNRLFNTINADRSQQAAGCIRVDLDSIRTLR